MDSDHYMVLNLRHGQKGLEVGVLLRSLELLIGQDSCSDGIGSGFDVDLRVRIERGPGEPQLVGVHRGCELRPGKRAGYRFPE